MSEKQARRGGAGLHGASEGLVDEKRAWTVAMVVLSMLVATCILSVSDVSSAYRTARWAVRGLGSEMLSNIASNIASNIPGHSKPSWHAPDGDGALAIVTGATGGIGCHVCIGDG